MGLTQPQIRLLSNIFAMVMYVHFVVPSLKIVPVIN